MLSEWLDRHRHALACAISMALTSLGVSLLTMASLPAPYRSDATDDEALTIVWIERRSATVAQPRRDEERPKRPARAHDRAHAAQAGRPAEHSTMPVAPSADAAASAMTPPARAPLNLRLPEPAIETISQTRAPWQRGAPEDLKPPPRIAVRIEDRSLFGIARGRECAELRAALSKGSESTYAIVESMRKRGCR